MRGRRCQRGGCGGGAFLACVAAKGILRCVHVADLYTPPAWEVGLAPSVSEQVQVRGFALTDFMSFFIHCVKKGGEVGRERGGEEEKRRGRGETEGGRGTTANFGSSHFLLELVFACLHLRKRRRMPRRGWSDAP